ncbi:MAG: mycofactocin biosynthesis chaperone MftB [Candidatus Competibacteraceae bacterium]
MSHTVDVTAGYRLAPCVAIRSERFGGLVYRYDNRRLYFLHSHQVVDFVNNLDGNRSLKQALDAFLASRQMPPTAGESLIKAIAQLEKPGILVGSHLS